MIYYVNGIPYSDEMYHSGVLGQKWGIRRYQYPDGTLTALGRIHYGYKSATEAVGKAAKATGQAAAKAGKAVAKYEIDKFKRNHPWMMTNEELDAQTLKAKKVSDLRTARETARGKTFVGKLSNTLWKSFGVGTDKLAENFGSKLAENYVKEVLFKSKEEKETKRLQDINDLRKAQKNRKENELQYRKNMDEFNYKKDLYEKSKRLEMVEKAKAALPKPKINDDPAIGSKKAVDDYVKQIEEAAEKERRRKLYGPGGTAYR